MSAEFHQKLGPPKPWYEVDSPGLTYDDVLLVPGRSPIESRADIDLSQQFGPYNLRIPAMSAPMDTIGSERMVRELARLGAIGTIPRGNIDINTAMSRRLADEAVPFVASVGLKKGYDDASRLVNEGGAQVILVDVAHGGMDPVIELAAKIKRDLGAFVIAGNIVTNELAEVYKDAGIDVARVGVGPGSVCTTRQEAGSGFPQLSAVLETTHSGIYVIADGGIRYPGDAAKALAAGAELVMLGSMFAGTNETPGQVINGRKIFRGQASREYVEDNNGTIGEYRAAEGVQTSVPAIGPVENVINRLSGGIRSAMSYAGKDNLQAFRERPRFIQITSATQIENQPHRTLTDGQPLEVSVNATSGNEA